MTELVFKGKEFVWNHHLAVPFRPLVPHADKGIGTPSLDGNLIIRGDNLHALKALLPLYAGKVDVIFIDPPYNTGNEGWAYNDNVNAPMIKEWLNANPIGIEDGLRHDKWCAMMWPRLRLLHELLAEDGLLFISIDDNENARLVQLVQELFGSENFLGQFIWKSRQNKDNRNLSGLSVDHEYVVAVGKNILGEPRTGSHFSNLDNDERGPWTSGNMVGMASRADRPNLHFDLVNPETMENFGCPDRGWRYSPDTMNELIRERRILWPENLSGRPREKVFLNELGSHTNVSSIISLPIYTKDGTLSYELIFGDRNFAFPKPPELIQFLLGQHHNPNALVLDSFAGSGTTAHAVLQANKRDGGNRRFILVEMEDYADRLTAERVRRVIKGYDFTGTQKTELLREKLTWRALEKASDLLHRIAAIENLHGHEYDRIKKEVTGSEVVITGEKAVPERAEALGGEFTYCTLGEPVEMDRILKGDELPSFSALGAVLFHMATSQIADEAAFRPDDFLLGHSGETMLWLIYKPQLGWLQSAEAALTLSFATDIHRRHPEKRHIVFAPARHASRRVLEQKGLNVEFAPLPFALYRVERA